MSCFILAKFFKEGNLCLDIRGQEFFPFPRLANDLETCRPVQDTFKKYLDTDTFSKMYLDTDTFMILSEKSI